jgi:hypothetical protein
MVSLLSCLIHKLNFYLSFVLQHFVHVMLMTLFLVDILAFLAMFLTLFLTCFGIDRYVLSVSLSIDNCIGWIFNIVIQNLMTL